MADTPNILSDLGATQGQSARESGSNARGFASPDSPPASTEGNVRPGADIRSWERSEVKHAQGRTWEKTLDTPQRTDPAAANAESAAKRLARLARGERRLAAAERDYQQRARHVAEWEAQTVGKQSRGFVTSQQAIADNEVIAKADRQAHEEVSADSQRWGRIVALGKQAEVTKLRKLVFKRTGKLMSVEDCADSIEGWLREAQERLNALDDDDRPSLGGKHGHR